MYVEVRSCLNLLLLTVISHEFLLSTPSVIFKSSFIGSNCRIKNSIILNDVYIGDNTVIENCIVESHNTIYANSTYIGDPNNVRVVVEHNDRYIM